MPINMLDHVVLNGSLDALGQVDFNKVPSLDFVVPVVVSDPVVTGADEGRIIYNTTSNTLKYCDGTVWLELGQAGAGGPPSGSAGGDLTGSYPNPQIGAGVIVDADVNATANIAQSKIGGLTTSLSSKADVTTTVTAGNGLTGGGSLAANRTISALAADASISVAVGGLSVVSAPKWTTGRTITLTGDITGASAAWDGSAAVSFATAIGAGVIVDADVNAAAAIATSKISGLDTALAARALTTVDLTAGAGLTGGGTLAANRTFAVGAGTGITVNADDVAINRAVVDTWYVDTAGDTMTGALTLNADPTLDMHAANKRYVDITSAGFSFKTAVRIVATTNLGLTGLAAIDGVTPIAGDRVLATAQTTTSQNGVYIAAAGAWTRATDMDASGELKDGTLIPVAEGTLNADSQWMCTAIGASPWVPGSSSSTWTKYTSLQDLQAGAGLTKTGNVVDIVGDATMNIAADSIGVLSAPKWTTGRTITLTGDVTGVSAAFDGTANLSFVTANAAGAIVDADVNASAAIATSKISGLDAALTGKVPTTRSVIAGTGLTGGGALSADVTLNVVGDANLSVTADQVAVLSAPKWTTARSITLTGDVTGTVASVDGTANVSIATTLVGGSAFPKKYAVDVPAGTTGIVITHSLNTLDVVVEVYNKTGGGTVYCDVARPTVNTVTLGFASAVSAGVYRVVVTG